MGAPGQRLIEELERGLSPLAALFAVLPAAHRDTVRRCAVVRRFDPDLYDALLAEPGGPSLGDLMRAGLARPAPGRPAAFALTAPMREAGWAAWWPGEPSAEAPEPLRVFAADLAEHYAAAGDETEQLRQLALADPDHAHERFAAAYREHEDALRLTRCQDLLDALAGPGPDPGPSAVREEYQLRLDSVAMWAPDILQTSRYLPREELQAGLRTLLDIDGPRVVELYAAGGMGKTMLLRWFIARHCLHFNRRVPCARVDFDLIDPLIAVTRPWLLLLSLAEQLDRQIVGAPFREFLADHARYRDALDRNPPAGPSPLADQLTDEQAAAVVARFTTVLSEARAGAPVVIVLDTLEEALLRVAAPMDRLVQLLAAVLGGAPEARVVLSGRHQASQSVPALFARLGRLLQVPVGPLTGDEMRSYLLDKRDLGDADLIEAIVTRCGGVPFTLALYADLAEAGAVLTAREVLQASEPALLYCIRRIVERIADNRVQWLLRYGVVPRQLTADFAAAVIIPALRRTMPAVDRTLDDPGPALDGISRTVFRPGPAPDRVQEPDELWSELGRYVSTTSWVTESTEEPGTLVFHPNVQGPLRRLVAGQPIYAQLHRDAVTYYRGRAEAELERWARWTREVVYHRAHLGQGQAAWREAVERAWSVERPDWVAALAYDRLGPAYQDEHGEADETLLPAQERYDAHVELARVAAERAAFGTGGSSITVLDAANELREAERVATEADLAPSPAARLVGALVAVARGDHDEAAAALAAVDPADGFAGGTYELVRLVIGLGRGRDEGAAAAERFAAAMPGMRPVVAQRGTVLIGKAYQPDRPSRAHRWFERASAVDGPLNASVTLANAEVLLALGRPTEALAALDVPASGSSHRPIRPERGVIAARALLALHRPTAALAVLTDARDPWQARDRLPRHVAPTFALVFADVCGALYQPEVGVEVLERAARGRIERADRARLTAGLALLRLRIDGDLPAAVQYITDDRDTDGPLDAAVRLDVELAHVEIVAHGRFASSIVSGAGGGGFNVGWASELRADRLHAAVAVRQASTTGAANPSPRPADAADRTRTLLSFAQVEADRFGRLGPGAPEAREALDGAISALEEAYGGLEPGGQERGLATMMLGWLLANRVHVYDGSSVDLDRGVALLEESLTVSGSAISKVTLGQLYLSRAVGALQGGAMVTILRGGRPDFMTTALDRAAALLREAAGDPSAGEQLKELARVLGAMCDALETFLASIGGGAGFDPRAIVAAVQQLARVQGQATIKPPSVFRVELPSVADPETAARPLLRYLTPLAARLREGSPAYRVRIATALLAYAPAGHVLRSTAAVALAQELAGIEPGFARLRLLDALSRCPTPPAEETGLPWVLRGVLDQWQAERSAALGREDHAVQQLVAVEVARMAGDADTARRWLDEATRTLGRHDPYAWLHWVDAADRIGPVTADERPPVEPPWKGLLCAEYLLRVAQRRSTVDPIPETLTRLDRARHLLEALDPLPRSCSARIRDERARVLARAGRTEEAHDQAAEAARLWARLGDDTARTASLRVAEAPTLEQRALPELAVRISADDDGARVHCATGSRRWSVHGLVSPQLDSWVGEASEHMFRAPYRAALRAVAADGPVDVRLQTAGSEAAALPWELLWAQRHGGNPDWTGVVYRGYGDLGKAAVASAQRLLHQLGRLELIDGVLGPRTWSALHRFQYERGLAAHGTVDAPTLRTLNFACGPGHTSTLVVVVTASSSSPVVGAYLRHGFQVKTVRPHQDRLHLNSVRPCVVHLCASMSTGRHRALRFDSTAVVEASAVDLALAPFSAAPPLVVLDTPRAATRSETVGQLRARNEFADRLMALDATGTLLATGLNRRDARLAQLNALAGAVGDGLTPAEATVRLREHATAAPILTDDSFGSAAAALFSKTPPAAQTPITELRE